MEDHSERKNWFGRNWKWAVPTGGCLLIIVLFVALAGSLFVGISGMMTDSQAYKDAMQKTKQNEIVINRLGEPIETNGMIKGNINYTNGVQKAALFIPIKGLNGEATIEVDGESTGDTWNYRIMEVVISESGEVINLLDDNSVLEAQ